MKVAAGDRPPAAPLVTEKQRIVGDGIDLVFHPTADEFDRFRCRPKDLWNASKRIRVLDASIGIDQRASAEQFAQTRGVSIRCWSGPRKLRSTNGRVHAVECETTRAGEAGKLEGTGQKYLLDADVVFKAIGQKLLTNPLANSAEIVELKQDRIVVDEQRRTSLPGVWAGGDCVHGGEDLTVSAVQDGKLAALSIDKALTIDKSLRSA